MKEGDTIEDWKKDVMEFINKAINFTNRIYDKLWSCRIKKWN